jgi:DNA-binding transcriptional ArsR family regulator
VVTRQSAGPSSLNQVVDKGPSIILNFNHLVETGGRMTADVLSRVFAALADPTRRDMVARLSAGDATASQLAEPYRMTLQAVYKHLRVLEDAGLVTRPPGPQPRPVHLEDAVFDLMDTWIERYRRRAEQRHRRLDAVLADLEGDEHGQDHRDSHRSRPDSAGHPDDS